jgi:hypothetical protein
MPLLPPVMMATFPSSLPMTRPPFASSLTMVADARGGGTILFACAAAPNPGRESFIVPP